jgi:hypothetical protein
MSIYRQGRGGPITQPTSFSNNQGKLRYSVRRLLPKRQKHPTHPSNAYIKLAIIPQMDEVLHCGVYLLIPLEATSPGDWCLDLEG